MFSPRNGDVHMLLVVSAPGHMEPCWLQGQGDQLPGSHGNSPAQAAPASAEGKGMRHGARAVSSGC